MPGPKPVIVLQRDDASVNAMPCRDSRQIAIVRCHSAAPATQDCTVSTPAGTPCPASVVASPYTPPTLSVQDSLVVIRVTDTTVRIRWSKLFSEPATLYRVTYGSDITDPYERVFAEIQPNPTIFSTVTGLETGVPYYFAVTPRNLNPAGWNNGLLGYSACPTQSPGTSWVHTGGGTYIITWQAPLWPLPIVDYRVWARLNSSTTASYSQVSSLPVSSRI